MRIVELTTAVLEKVTSMKLAKAERRNNEAIRRVKQAKDRVDKSSFQYRKTQADILIQLTKLNKIEQDINRKAVSHGKKSDAIASLLQAVED